MKNTSNSSKIKSFTDLFAWQEAHQLILMIYNITESFPKEELFGLTSQIRRAAVSISSNIAEGFGRKSIREKIRFYFIAKSSLIEIQNQLLIAKDVKYIEESKFKIISEQSIKVHKIIIGLIKSSKRLF